MSKYNTPISWKLVYIVGFLSSLYFAIRYLLIVLSEPSFLQIHTLIFLVWSVLAGYHFFRLFDHLILDENGFQYHTLGTTYAGQWSDVQRLGNQGIQQGVYISKERLTSGKTWYTPQELFIPLAVFVPKWQESTLKLRIDKYLSETES